MLGEGEMWGGNLGYHGCSLSSSGLRVAVISQDVGQAQDTVHLQMERKNFLVYLERESATACDSHETEPTPLTLLRRAHTPYGVRENMRRVPSQVTQSCLCFEPRKDK